MHVSNIPHPRGNQESFDAEWLAEHLIRDHDRAPHEIVGLPLRDVHDLEHFDDTVGLLDLRHRH